MAKATANKTVKKPAKKAAPKAKAKAKTKAKAPAAKTKAKKPVAPAKKPAGKPAAKPATKTTKQAAKPAAKPAGKAPKAAAAKAPAKTPAKAPAKTAAKAPAKKREGMQVGDVKLTANEVQVLAGILGSNYYDPASPSGQVWSWSANTFDNARSFSGAVTSLVKKKILIVDGAGEEAVLAITDSGQKVLAEANITPEKSKAKAPPTAKKAKGAAKIARGKKTDSAVTGQAISLPRIHVIDDKEKWFLVNEVRDDPTAFFDEKTLQTPIKTLIAKRADIRDALTARAGNGIDDVTNVGSIGGYFARQINRELGEVLDDDNQWSTDSIRMTSFLGILLSGLVSKKLAEKAKSNTHYDRAAQDKKIAEQIEILEAAKNTGDTDAMRKAIAAVDADKTLSDASVCAIAVAVNEWMLRMEGRSHQAGHPVYTRKEAIAVLEASLPNAVDRANRNKNLSKAPAEDGEEAPAPAPEKVETPKKGTVTAKDAASEEIVVKSVDQLDYAYGKDGITAVPSMLNVIAKANDLSILRRVTHKVTGSQSALFASNAGQMKKMILDYYQKREDAKNKLIAFRSKTTASSKKKKAVARKKAA